MHSGMTVRQAGDQLEIPTSTLRHWLREAGLELGPNGTLADPEPAGASDRPGATRLALWFPACQPLASTPLSSCRTSVSR